MKGVDADGPAGPDIHVIRIGSSSDDHGMDVIETASRRRPPWWRRPERGPVVAALIVGLLAGYLIGVRTSGAHTPDPEPSSGPGVSRDDSVLVTPAAEPLAATGSRCSSQHGNRLLLGVEIVSQSTTPVTVLRVDPHFPLAGLRVTATAWGACGQASPLDGRVPLSLAPDTTSWFTVTLDVLVPCPAPLPVLFAVTYENGNMTGVAELGGFPDLGEVPYTGCTVSPG